MSEFGEGPLLICGHHARENRPSPDLPCPVSHKWEAKADLSEHPHADIERRLLDDIVAVMDDPYEADVVAHMLAERVTYLD